MSQSYVTLTTSDFVLGTVALFRSLRRTGTNYPLTVMHSGLARDRIAFLSSMGMRLREVEPIANPYNGSGTKRRRFLHTYTKLRAFGLTEFEKVVFLDSDMIVLRPIDELFQAQPFAACPDLGKEWKENQFNSGLMVIAPSKELEAELVGRVQSVPSRDNSDQGFLNQHFINRWHPLDRRYNTLKRMYRHFPDRFDLTEIKVLHYVGGKPWKRDAPKDEREYRDLHRLWWKYYRDEGDLKVPPPSKLQKPAGPPPPSEKMREALHGHKRSDTLVIYGCGYSINDLTAEQRQKLDGYDSIGFNWFCFSNIPTTFYLVREQAIGAQLGSETRTELVRRLGSDQYVTSMVLVSNLRTSTPDWRRGYDWAANVNRFANKTIVFNERNGKLLWGKGKARTDRVGEFMKRVTEMDPFDNGVLYDFCSMSTVLHIATHLNYQNIVFAGVDLYDHKYFWLRPNELRKVTRIKGRGLNTRHHVAPYTVSMVQAYRQRFPDKALSVVNPKSLLAGAVPVWEG
jgi:hypothetical protein